MSHLQGGDFITSCMVSSIGDTVNVFVIIGVMVGLFIAAENVNPDCCCCC